MQKLAALLEFTESKHIGSTKGCIWKSNMSNITYILMT